MLHEPIKDVKGKGWCGPTAISAITQTPISKIQKMVRRVRADRERKHHGRVLNGGNAKNVNGGKMPVRGMYNFEVIEVMRRLKFNTDGEKSFKGTFRDFCDDCGHMGPFIVQVTRHYIAVSKGMACDTYTNKPVPWNEHPLLRKQVHKVIRF